MIIDQRKGFGLQKILQSESVLKEEHICLKWDTHVCKCAMDENHMIIACLEHMIDTWFLKHIICIINMWLATGQWFSPGPPDSSTKKTARHDITEILLTLTPSNQQTNIQYFVFYYRKLQRNYWLNRWRNIKTQQLSSWRGIQGINFKLKNSINMWVVIR